MTYAGGVVVAAAADPAREELEAELRLLSEHAPIGFCYLDRDLRYRRHNRRYVMLLGLAEQSLEGRLLTEVVSPDFYDAMKDSLHKALAGEQVVYERQGAACDAQVTSVRATLVPRTGGRGAVIGVYALLQDVTERSVAEDALRRSKVELEMINLQLRDAQMQLLQAAKLAAIGQLASGVAHEINNPIGFVSSNLGTLEHYLRDIFGLLDRYDEAANALAADAVKAELRAAREVADIDFVRDDVTALVAESKEGIARVKQIVADLKNFSRTSEGEAWEHTDIHEGLDSTLNIVKNELKYKVDVRKDYGAVPEIECRPSQLNQVFMNMLVNGADAIVERGVITIRSGVDGEFAWVEFEDTGSGIAPEHLSRIFDPFFTTKPVGKGTGLGLAVSYGIVAEHGGRIDVKSDVGRGATFRVWLPLAQPAPSAHGAAARASAAV